MDEAGNDGSQTDSVVTEMMRFAAIRPNGSLRRLRGRLASLDVMLTPRRIDTSAWASQPGATDAVGCVDRRIGGRSRPGDRGSG